MDTFTCERDYTAISVFTLYVKMYNHLLCSSTRRIMSPGTMHLM